MGTISINFTNTNNREAPTGNNSKILTISNNRAPSGPSGNNHTNITTINNSKGLARPLLVVLLVKLPIIIVT